MEFILKNSTSCLLFLFVAFFFSCSDSMSEKLNSEVVVSPRHCGQYCNYTYQLDKIGEEEECCEYFFSVDGIDEMTNPSCIFVTINGVVFDPSNNSIIVCEGEEVVIEFFGYNKEDVWGVCNEVRIGCGCCYDVDMRIDDVSMDGACCVYEIVVNNDSDCVVNLNGSLNGPIIVPQGESTHFINGCEYPNDRITLRADGQRCKTLELEPCSCCDATEMNIVDAQLQNGCCIYTVEVVNNSQCPVELLSNSNLPEDIFIPVPLGISEHSVSGCDLENGLLMLIVDGNRCNLLPTSDDCIVP